MEEQNMDPLKGNMDLMTRTWIHWKRTWIWWTEHWSCCSIWNGVWISNSKERTVCLSSVWLGWSLSILANLFHMEVHFWIGPCAHLGFDPQCFPLQALLHLGFQPWCRSLCYGLILGLCLMLITSIIKPFNIMITLLSDSFPFSDVSFFWSVAGVWCIFVKNHKNSNINYIRFYWYFLQKIHWDESSLWA